jgi:hypothetical protein
MAKDEKVTITVTNIKNSNLFSVIQYQIYWQWKSLYKWKSYNWMVVNEILQNLRYITKFWSMKLCSHPSLLNFITSLFYFWSFQMFLAKFESHSDSFEFRKLWTWRWRKIKKSLLQLPMHIPCTHQPRWQCLPQAPGNFRMGPIG